VIFPTRPKAWHFALAALLTVIFGGLMVLGVDPTVPIAVVVVAVLAIAAPQVLGRLGSLGDPPDRG
jgi:hypothetical protein